MKHPPPSRMLCNCPPNIVSFGYLPTLLLQHPGQASVVPMRYNRLRDFQGRDYGLSTISSTTWWFLACMVDNKCFWNEWINNWINKWIGSLGYLTCFLELFWNISEGKIKAIFNYSIFSWTRSSCLIVTLIFCIFTVVKFKELFSSSLLKDEANQIC